MNVQGVIIVDIEPLSKGMYDLICENGDEAIVAHGMIPAPVMDSLRRLLREKVLKMTADKLECTVQDLAENPIVKLDEKKIREIVQTIETAVCIGIFKAAQDAGRMLV